MENLVDMSSAFMLLILAFLAALRIQAFMMKKAISQVIDRFRERNSLCSQGSKTADQLELQPPPFLERLFRLRDYKPYALQLLIRRAGQEPCASPMTIECACWKEGFRKSNKISACNEHIVAEGQESLR
jgi:hypothetical protein